MSEKGNIEKVLGGAFLALPGLDGDVEPGKPLLEFDSPKAIFEKTFDGAVLEFVRKNAPGYNQLVGRFDPFDHERLLTSVGTWSVLIDRAVVTFQDACDHALELCRLWREEDGELAKIAVQKEERRVSKEAAAETDILVEGTKAYEIEQARLAWRAAVKVRNEALKELNETVQEKRKEYHRLRDS